VVLVPEDERYPGGEYQRAADVTRLVLGEWRGVPPDLQDPELFREWYRRLYDISRVGEGQASREKGIAGAFQESHFGNVASLYRLIPDDAAQVVVPWDEKHFEKLRRDSAASPWIKVDWLRAAQVHSVSLYRSELERYLQILIAAPLGARLPEHRSNDWFLLSAGEAYGAKYGLGEPPSALLA
jgi:hypothetical protein